MERQKHSFNCHLRHASCRIDYARREVVGDAGASARGRPGGRRRRGSPRARSGGAGSAAPRIGVFGIGTSAYFVYGSAPEALIPLFSSWALALALLVVAVARSVRARRGA